MIKDFISRIWPFAPAIMIFIGAVIVAFGGFWASFRQSGFNAELQDKNKEITRLQADNTGFITGGDSFPELSIAMRTAREPDKYQILILNHGRFPLYDVQVRFVDLVAVEASRASNPANMGFPEIHGTVLHIGNITPGFMVETNFIIQHKAKEDINYNIFFTARNGAWAQNMRMKFIGNDEARASRVLREGQEVWRGVSKNFPLGPGGDVEW
jgi:hypothetical protein